MQHAQHLEKRSAKAEKREKGGVQPGKTGVRLVFLTESSKSPASIAKSNKQWVGTCLYQEECKLLLITAEQLFGYEQVAKRIANIRLTSQETSRNLSAHKIKHRKTPRSTLVGITNVIFHLSLWMALRGFR